MQIGKGGMTLAHLSLMNSITYDQKRRDQLINYRNSVAYAAGLIVPGLSTYLFNYVTTE
jgi:Na+/melibiose symporter-like transporter